MSIQIHALMNIQMQGFKLRDVLPFVTVHKYILNAIEV